MSNLLVMRPIQPVSSSLTQGTATGIANLLTPDPKEVVSCNAGAGVGYGLDLGAIYSIDSMFLGHLNNYGSAADLEFVTGVAAHNETVRLDANYLAEWIAPSARSIPRRRHAFWRAAAPFNARYVMVRGTFAGTTPVTLGVFGVGLAFQPTYNQEWGAGRQPLDTSGITELRSGGFGIDSGGKKAAYTWTLGDLTDIEVQSAWSMFEDAGNSSPIIVVEDPDSPAATIIDHANTTVAGTTITKTGGSGSAWDAGAVSTTAIEGGMLTFKVAQANKEIMVGLNSDPLTDDSYSSLDFAIYLTSGGGVQTWMGGVAQSIFASTTYVTGDRFTLHDDGQTVWYKKNEGVIFAAPSPKVPLYFDSSFFSSAGALNDVLFRKPGLNERIHYGLFDRFEPYERLSPGRTRWGLRMNEWI